MGGVGGDLGEWGGAAPGVQGECWLPCSAPGACGLHLLVGGKASSPGPGAPCTDPELSVSGLMLVLADAPVQLRCEYAGEVGLGGKKQVSRRAARASMWGAFS